MVWASRNVANFTDEMRTWTKISRTSGFYLPFYSIHDPGIGTSSVEGSSITLHRNDTDALTHRRETRLLQTVIPQAQWGADTSRLVVRGCESLEKPRIKPEQVLVQYEARFVPQDLYCDVTYSSARRRGCRGSPAIRHTSSSGAPSSRHRTPRTSLWNTPAHTVYINSNSH